MKNYTKAELKARAEKNAQAQPDAAVVMSNGEANKDKTLTAQASSAPLMTLSGKPPKRTAPPPKVTLAQMLIVLVNACEKKDAHARKVALANPDVLREVVTTQTPDAAAHKWAKELLAELTVGAAHVAIAKAGIKSDKTVKSAPPAPKSKKAAPKKQGNTKSHDTRKPYALIDSGICPHDGAKLEKEQPSGTNGAKAKCSKCGHEWYINRKIHTRACRTCQAAARKTTKGVVHNVS